MTLHNQEPRLKYEINEACNTQIARFSPFLIEKGKITWFEKYKHVTNDIPLKIIPPSDKIIFSKQYPTNTR